MNNVKTSFFILQILFFLFSLNVVADFDDIYSNEGYKFYEQDILDTKTGDDRSTDTSDTVSFEKMAKKMVDITTDGGVKKQTILHGIGEVIPQDANVFSN